MLKQSERFLTAQMPDACFLNIAAQSPRLQKTSLFLEQTLHIPKLDIFQHRACNPLGPCRQQQSDTYNMEVRAGRGVLRP